MEKYGFVYIWYDRKHKRYYVGCHWGTEDDGYICSSSWMLQAYKHRPNDFKRRILSRVYTERKDMFLEEQRWFNMIKPEELKVKYYNLNITWKHWQTDPLIEQSIKQRISTKTKEAMWRPDVRQKYIESLKTKDNGSSRPEVIEKRRQSMIETMSKKFPVENRYNPPKFGSDEYRRNMAKSIAKSWENRDKDAIGEKISKSLQQSKEKRSQLVSSLKWYNNGLINKRLAVDPGEGWIAGRVKYS